VRLLVGQASAAGMPPSSLQGCIHGGLSGKQPYPEDYFHLPGRCPAFMSVTLKVTVAMRSLLSRRGDAPTENVSTVFRTAFVPFADQSFFWNKKGAVRTTPFSVQGHGKINLP